MPDTPNHRELTEREAALIAHFRETEARLLRDLAAMRDSTSPTRFDERWLAIARTHFDEGFMALVRAIVRPEPFTDEAAD